jgi:hypothetical protein
MRNLGSVHLNSHVALRHRCTSSCANTLALRLRSQIHITHRTTTSATLDRPNPRTFLSIDVRHLARHQKADMSTRRIPRSAVAASAVDFAGSGRLLRAMYRDRSHIQVTALTSTVPHETTQLLPSSRYHPREEAGAEARIFDCGVIWARQYKALRQQE